MTRRFLIRLEYDGTNYCGWQRQANNRSVQELLETALRSLNNNQPVAVIGSGRTDSGVHALDQVAHFDLETNLTPETIRRALDAKIPKDIYVRECMEVDGQFHARFSAKRRTYIYQILLWTTVFQRDFAWYPGFNYDTELLDQCAGEVIGNHDFTRFCLTSTESESKVCTIFESEWKKGDSMLIYRITGNRFLHSMVRILVGTMMEVARGKYTTADFKNLLDKKNRSVQVYTAPAKGLFLYNVAY